MTNSAPTPTPPDPRTTPHAYVPTAVRQWRTCQVCGIGANAKIHKAER